MLGLDATKTVAISAKTGKNMSSIIRQIICQLPPPRDKDLTYRTLDLDAKEFSNAVRKQKDKLLLRQIGMETSRAYVFDSWFEENKGTTLTFLNFRRLIIIKQ